MSSRLLLALGAPVLSVVLLAGCGSDPDPTAEDPAGSTSPDDTPSSPTEAADGDGDWPECSRVWRDDATIPEDYVGCLDGGDVVEADGLECSSGQFILTHDDRFWAVAGGPVAGTDGPLLDDPKYQAVLESCRG